MAQARVFIPQEALESWLSGGRGQVIGETLLLDGVSFALTGAVRFLSEVAGGGDEVSLVGKVKSLAQLDELGGEHVSGSVVLGDNAYEVLDGYLAVPDKRAQGAVPTVDKLIKMFQQK
jgi:hypothetical protein